MLEIQLRRFLKSLTVNLAMNRFTRWIILNSAFWVSSFQYFELSKGVSGGLKCLIFKINSYFSIETARKYFIALSVRRVATKDYKVPNTDIILEKGKQFL